MFQLNRYWFMKRRWLSFFVCSLFFGLTLTIHGQSSEWYLSGSGQPFREDIPKPEAYLGYEVGAWHVDHTVLNAYMQQLAAVSDRVVIQEYGRSHEQRPLSVLIITSASNHARLDAIREMRQRWCDPEEGVQEMNVEDMPGVLYQGYSIHGNEPSGGNASMLVAWYLAASESEQVKTLLDENIILLDPCLNPDGFQRFATWANSNRSMVSNGDPAHRELNEAWPGGRTNHYWFDLNRDWLLLQQPESVGRVALFQEWKPNILTDHHEMGSDATFFFMPGIQSRTNPLTPPRNQELTFELADFHAKALDEIQSLYFTQQSFDDFYIGKGSTYPDVNGGIGILFEQASSRGHLRQTSYGPLTFPYTIRNQVTTSLSTLEGLQKTRKTLLTYQREFFESALKTAQEDSRSGFVFQALGDPYRMDALCDLLDRHHIQWAPLHKDLTVNGVSYTAGDACGVLLSQPQYRLVLGMFDTLTEFQDSLFYDVSAWTLPLAYGMQYSEVPSAIDLETFLNRKNERASQPAALTISSSENVIAYAWEWTPFLSPRLTWQLLDEGYRLRVATKGFTGQTIDGPVEFRPGTILLARGIQDRQANISLLEDLSQKCSIKIHSLTSSLTPTGIDLGSRDIESLPKPRILLIAGEGVRAYDAGEIWHILDQRYQIPVTITEPEKVGRTKLENYSVIVIPPSSGSALGSLQKEELERWVRSGGTLIAFDRSIRWLSSNGLLKAKMKKSPEEKPEVRLPYDTERATSGAQFVGGAIFEAMMDVTHPLCFGYSEPTIALFKRGTLAPELADNPRADPIVYASEPLLSGYASPQNQHLIGGSSALQVHGLGAGRIVCFAHNPIFRGYWLSTSKLFANALFFSSMIDGNTVER